MLLLDGISVGGGQSIRERGFTSIMSVTMFSSLCKCLASTMFGSTVAMCLSARVVARRSTPTAALRDTISLCLASLTVQEELLPLLHVGQRPLLRRSSSIWSCGGRRRGRGLFWPAPGRGQTSSTLSNGNLLCWFLINFLRNLCCNWLLTTTSFFFFIFIFEIPVRRKMLGVSPATNILIIQPWGKSKESYQPSLGLVWFGWYCGSGFPCVKTVQRALLSSLRKTIPAFNSGWIPLKSPLQHTSRCCSKRWLILHYVGSFEMSHYVANNIAKC